MNKSESLSSLNLWIFLESVFEPFTLQRWQTTTFRNQPSVELISKTVYSETLTELLSLNTLYSEALNENVVVNVKRIYSSVDSLTWVLSQVENNPLRVHSRGFERKNIFIIYIWKFLGEEKLGIISQVKVGEMLFNLLHHLAPWS